MIDYSLYNKTDDHSYNVLCAVKHCIECGEDGITFPHGEYHFYPEMASECELCVSNHDIYGYRRIAFILSGMDNFHIDGMGSTFIFHGEMMPFYINDSSNITIKNLSIEYEKNKTLQLLVTEANENYFDAEAVKDTEYYVSNGKLYIHTGYGQSDIMHSFMIRTVDNTDEYKKGTDEEFLCLNDKLRFEDIGAKKLRFHSSNLKVDAGMTLLAASNKRALCNIVINKSSHVTLDSLTMYSSYAMGVLAQVSSDITIDKMQVKAHGKELYSLSADATHFVNCYGLVKVTNSSFSNQLDDAINVHGIFTQVTHVDDGFIIVKYMHKSAKGIDIYDAGDEICVLNPRSLVGGKHYTVKKAEAINLNYTKLYLCESTDGITVGYDVENITKNCDLIFEGNTVKKNRARGMLVGTKGRVDIRNNYFHTSGASILFESDGEYWFESGGTRDVRIYENTFENCCTGPVHWGNGVIETVARREIEEGVHYHKSICITDNKFISNTSPVLLADNIYSLTFKNNFSDRNPVYSISHCEKVDM